jgi:hypothetical protein
MFSFMTKSAKQTISAPAHARDRDFALQLSMALVALGLAMAAGRFESRARLAAIARTRASA